MTTSGLKKTGSPRAALRISFVMPWLLAGFAVLYYGAYVDAGLNLGGEGGTAGVVAMRLLGGARPIVDTFLGYNVMWFFPVAWLFELTGPNYLALRWFFFAFCTASGLLSYFLVFNHTRNSWFAAVPAIFVILAPGMLFRNYMPFLGVLNAVLLTQALVARRDSPVRTLFWMAAAGAGLGITYLFRIDLGIFCTIIFAGLAVLFPLGEREHVAMRIRLAVGGTFLVVLACLLVQLPFWLDARGRGYEKEFLEQYSGWGNMVVGELRNHLPAAAVKQPEPAAMAEVPTPAATPQPAQSPSEAVAPSPAKTETHSWEDRGALARPRLRDIIDQRIWSKRSLALCTYLPVLISAFAIMAWGASVLFSLLRRDPESKTRALYTLTALGCALTLFPQFFFFRPDTPHLSEMMVPFIGASALLLWDSLRVATKARHLAVRMAAFLFAALCATTVGIYYSHAVLKASAGTIRAKKSATHAFHALNGVDVKVDDREAVWLPGLRDAILNYSNPGEDVLCLPYSPTINFMTDRPSPLHNLYVDNTVGEAEFLKYFLLLVGKKPPAVIVVDQRPINSNEISRFRNWAPGTYAWLWKNYVFVGRFARNEVFVRPDKKKDNSPPQYIEVVD